MLKHQAHSRLHRAGVDTEMKQRTPGSPLISIIPYCGFIVNVIFREPKMDLTLWFIGGIARIGGLVRVFYKGNNLTVFWAFLNDYNGLISAVMKTECHLCRLCHTPLEQSMAAWPPSISRVLHWQYSHPLIEMYSYKELSSRRKETRFSPRSSEVWRSLLYIYHVGVFFYIKHAKVPKPFHILWKEAGPLIYE